MAERQSDIRCPSGIERFLSALNELEQAAADPNLRVSTHLALSISRRLNRLSDRASDCRTAGATIDDTRDANMSPEDEDVELGRGANRSQHTLVKSTSSPASLNHHAPASPDELDMIEAVNISAVNAYPPVSSVQRNAPHDRREDNNRKRSTTDDATPQAAKSQKRAGYRDENMGPNVPERRSESSSSKSRPRTICARVPLQTLASSTTNDVFSLTRSAAPLTPARAETDSFPSASPPPTATPRQGRAARGTEISPPGLVHETVFKPQVDKQETCAQQTKKTNMMKATQLSTLKWYQSMVDPIADRLAQKIQALRPDDAVQALVPVWELVLELAATAVKVYPWLTKHRYDKGRRTHANFLLIPNFAFEHVLRVLLPAIVAKVPGEWRVDHLSLEEHPLALPILAPIGHDAQASAEADQDSESWLDIIRTAILDPSQGATVADSDWNLVTCGLFEDLVHSLTYIEEARQWYTGPQTTVSRPDWREENSAFRTRRELGDDRYPSPVVGTISQLEMEIIDTLWRTREKA